MMLKGGDQRVCDMDVEDGNIAGVLPMGRLTATAQPLGRAQRDMFLRDLADGSLSLEEMGHIRSTVSTGGCSRWTITPSSLTSPEVECSVYRHSHPQSAPAGMAGEARVSRSNSAREYLLRAGRARRGGIPWGQPI
jgi:hypothetical protein